ncbi:MAG TPA: hypothetical protein DCY25_08170 [Bacteroidales bacterium]|nr:hypothetical protein [Bacteroidales bacterium]
MKTRFFSLLAGTLIIGGALMPCKGFSQDGKAFTDRYLSSLPKVNTASIQRKYRMTTVHINRDLHGAFQSKSRVTGDYTRGFADGHMTWDNVFIAHSNSLNDPFPAGTKQEYIENFSYLPTDNMLSAEAFKNFPASPDNVLARNLVWDMMTFETYAWMFWDSLEINVPHVIRQTDGKFSMAEIGTYDHNVISVCWKGITAVDGELCAVIDFTAIDNLLEITMDMMSSRGTEQYWGTTWVSLTTRNIEKAVMYGGVMQEIDLRGMPQKILVKTVRELWVEPLN